MNVLFSLEQGVSLLPPYFLVIVSLIFLVKFLLVAVNRAFKNQNASRKSYATWQV